MVQKFIEVSAERGIDVFRIFDSLNWVENMKMPIEVALNTGKIVEGSICYTGDILDPNEQNIHWITISEKQKSWRLWAVTSSQSRIWQVF